MRVSTVELSMNKKAAPAEQSRVYAAKCQELVQDIDAAEADTQRAIDSLVEARAAELALVAELEACKELLKRSRAEEEDARRESVRAHQGIGRRQRVIPIH